MTDAKQTLEDQLNYPGAEQAPGKAASGPGAGPSAPADGSRVDGAGATSSGAIAPDEVAHALEPHDAAALAGDLDELIKTAKQRDDYLALAQRTQADFENYRKRVAREAAAAQERGVCSLAKELLPALDNLDRAIAHADQHDP